jgi:serine/threonine protein kinase
MRRDDEIGEDPWVWQAARPPIPEGAVRRLSQGLLQHRLFGRPRPQLGRFEVTDKLGEGGMGAVFEAIDPVLGRRVALKVLREPDRPVPGLDIGHEARMLARLSHPNVVAVHELGEADGEAYVCMARVDGPHLGAWLAARAGASWQEVTRVLVGAARGLHAAHRAGLVHRDFKLENVLVGSDGTPQVTDFGLARVGPAPGALIHHEAGASASRLAGTPGYLAPEVLAGAPADARSDQFSFCVALRRAFTSAATPPPAAVQAAMDRGLAPLPEARWPDVGALADALEALLRRRGNPDQRARDVLLSRVRQQWIEPVRAAALRATGFELPLRCEAREGPMPGDGQAPALARALHETRAAIVLIGAPGAGKTLRLLAVAEALVRLDAEIDGATLPVVLNLSSFPSHGGDLVAWVRHEVVAKYALPRADVERWMDDGTLALLLDGLDEVAPDDRARCVAALDALRAERPLAWLMTCREGVFDSLPRPATADMVLRLCPPTQEELRLALAAVPGAVDDPALVEQLTNPLLLSLFLRVTAEGARQSPTSLRERLYADTLRHALQPITNPSDRAAAEARLIWLAQASARAGVTDVWLEDLQTSWLARPAQRWMATGLGLTLIYGLSFAANIMAARVAALPAASGWFFGWLAATAAIVIQGHLRVVPMEAMRWSWPRVRTWIPRNLALGVLTGLLHGVFYDLWADLLLGTATGLLGLSVIGLVPQGRERRANPGDGLLESLRNAAMVAPLIGVIIGAPVGWLVLPLAAPLADPSSMYHTHPSPGFAWAVTMGTSAAVTSALITGLFAPLLHLGLRLTLVATTPMPWRLVPALDELARRGLLLRIGGGWMFRHPTFRAWLAERG